MMSLPVEELMLNAVAHSDKQEGERSVRSLRRGTSATVLDSGPGIAGRMRTRFTGRDDELVRQAFVSGVTSTDDPMRGWGLTRVLSWVESHGAQLTIESGVTSVLFDGTELWCLAKSDQKVVGTRAQVFYMG